MVSVNPVKSIRERLHMTQQAMATQAGLSVNTLIYTEKGMYQNIPIKLLGMLVEREPMLPKMYKEWIREKRQDVAAPFNITPPYPEIASHVHFRETILRMSVNEYASSFCVERKSVYAIEHGVQRRVPLRIRQAITEAFGTEFGDHFYRSLTPAYFRGSNG